MSVNKLVKYLNKPRPTREGLRSYTPVVLTDSKGNCLKSKVEHQSEREIVWWAKSGDEIKDRFNWLKDNLDHKLNSLGKVWRYVWLGTSDLTSKNKKYISLTSKEGNDTVDHIVSYFSKILDLVKTHPNCRVTILETHIYSISKYNKQTGHKDTEPFQEQDSELKRQIYLLNQEARKLNNSVQLHSPSFSVDLIYKTIVKKGDHRKPTNTKKVNINVYADGIHPDHLLTKTWVRRIAEQTIKDCTTN
jgi:hypothetical protein